jgi:glutamate synthase domain-containing protein 3
MGYVKYSMPETIISKLEDITMELKETVEMMNSADYKERFKAEYQQVVIRYQKLAAMLEKWDNGELNFTPTCPRSTYNMQVRAMTDYIAVLEARAVMEGVELGE